MSRKYHTKSVNDVEIDDLLVMGPRANRVGTIDDSDPEYRTLYVFAGTETWSYKPVSMARTTTVQTVTF